MSEEIIETIVTNIPEEHLGDLVALFDEAGLGSSLRMPYTINKGQSEGLDVNVTFLDEDKPKALKLVEQFKQLNWAKNPSIESITVPELSPEDIAAAKQRLAARGIEI